MSAPYDRPASGEPGGCECFDCGVIFIGAPWHMQCAACARDSDASLAEDPQGLSPEGVAARAEGIAQPNPPEAA